ncbi:hypothetical protein MMC10_011339 [Thelotrema lepadinum]|nr:hypothetical protein [Thelotrema lepadinum]
MKFTQLSHMAILAAIVYGQGSSEGPVGEINAITDLSSATDDLAQSISITNFLETAPQLLDNFQQIVELVSNDIAAASANITRKVKKRQDCDNAGKPKKCVDVARRTVQHPRSLLSDKKAKGRTGSHAANAKMEHWKKRQSPPIPSPYTETNQLAICDAFREFVLVHQQLLATVIGTHGILALTPFTQPLAEILRLLEGGVDTLAFGIIDAVPTCAGEATDNKNSLDDSLQRAVDTYN